MPDAWERRFGLDPSSDDRLLDADNDGQTNRDEFLAGTDPRDRQSVLRLQYGWAGDQLKLHWDAKAGRSYTLLESSEINPASWRRHSDFSAEVGDRNSQIFVPLAPTGEPHLYRLVTPSSP
jgi:hypothetical protein